VVGITAGDQRLDQASIDLRVSAVSAGFGRGPFQLRVLANGTEIERRRVVPTAEGAPIDEVFTVSPDPATPTVYTAEIPADPSESIVENNRRSVLVNPAPPQAAAAVEGCARVRAQLHEARMAARPRPRSR
jgi:hypothetical protein